MKKLFNFYKNESLFYNLTWIIGGLEAAATLIGWLQHYDYWKIMFVPTAITVLVIVPVAAWYNTYKWRGGKK
jgi:hypothetical protein